MNERTLVNVKNLDYRAMVSSRFDGPVDVQLHTNEALGQISLKVKKYFYERITGSEIVNKRNVPVYKDRNFHVPRSGLDVILRSCDRVLARAQNKMKRIRNNGYLQSNKSTNRFENWFLNLRVPYSTDVHVHSVVSHYEEFTTTIVHKNICPHCNVKPESPAHSEFLISGTQNQIDRHTLIAAAKLFDDLIKEYPNHKSYEHHAIVHRIKYLMKDYT